MRSINHVSGGSYGSDVAVLMFCRSWMTGNLLGASPANLSRDMASAPLEVLRERADCCAGDNLSAEAWLDIADAAERLLDGPND